MLLLLRFAWIGFELDHNIFSAGLLIVCARRRRVCEQNLKLKPPHPATTAALFFITHPVPPLASKSLEKHQYKTIQLLLMCYFLSIRNAAAAGDIVVEKYS